MVDPEGLDTRNTVPRLLVKPLERAVELVPVGDQMDGVADHLAADVLQSPRFKRDAQGGVISVEDRAHTTILEGHDRVLEHVIAQAHPADVR